MKLDSIVTVALMACAALTTGLAVRHELFPSSQSPKRSDQHPVFVKTWGEGFKLGEQMGSQSAPVQLMEFADFECPFCGSFYRALKGVEDKYPGKIGLTYIHFPLPGHRFAMLAARVAECANDQGRFAAIYDQLFDGQDQFGLKPWDDYATAAGVPDMAAFHACIKKSDPIPRVEEGKALGDQLDVQGTPSVIINGWKLGRPPSQQELGQMVQRILAGKSPVDSKS